jgi:hypothetical protein
VTNPELAIAIYTEYHKWGTGIRALARKYNVPKFKVWKIVRGKEWSLLTSKLGIVKREKDGHVPGWRWNNSKDVS